MNKSDKYRNYALVNEMLETSGIIRDFRVSGMEKPVEQAKKLKKVLFTGEGSSRIFPSKNAMALALRRGGSIHMVTEGSYQAKEYKLDDFVVFASSNSGQTKETISLIDQLANAGHQNLYAVTANYETPLEKLSNMSFVLNCGKEDAVAATKSVVEQALVYVKFVSECADRKIDDELSPLADAVAQALETDVPKEMVDAMISAPTVYFAGRNDGVAEELTLKTNEIVRKKSDFLEGTYLLHGIEEVMHKDDVIILIDPFKQELEQIRKTLGEGVGVKIFAISSQKTIFDGIQIPYTGPLASFVHLCAGWNLLVEAGLSLGIDLDHPVRARKVGNEYKSE
ncbi:glucosamine--fructose-6-phosphate aminotransferase [Limihaloglobus sulfuriphilus]|uniref:Glucosamine--fructose-6-phosphate aminotransferase n=1 Tax=Limihaloglobus sulfuriphilus TaxID=1851148 RepID=A0A1Q2MDV4_9BACT|nr:SIS domain-containing protein [Limihaloglobus sulfuriphilus]AQQ70829.1 glucosamine--fructose-6-phosphate aminotransferase [Limihaloglobus sulfuriphilus]